MTTAITGCHSSETTPRGSTSVQPQLLDRFEFVVFILTSRRYWLVGNEGTRSLDGLPPMLLAEQTSELIDYDFIIL